MAATAEVLTMDLVPAVAQDPGIVLLDSEKFDAWYERLKADAPTDVDISTNKGRDTLRSYAAKVRSEKSAIDKARLRLTKEWRDMTAQANAAGKVIEERLETLAIEVRQPLTEWEDAEKARVAECQATIAGFNEAAIVTIDDTADTVRQRGVDVWNTALDEDRFKELHPQALAVKEQAVATLRAALVRLEKEEAERAELERLRAEQAERERAEAERREAEEAERRRQEEEREAEARRVAAEQAEQERIAAAAREAEERAKREAEEAAEAERERVRREHEEALAVERRRAEEAERAAKAERDRIAAEEVARQAEAQRIADEQAKRDADQKHRTSVKAAAKTAIMSCGADEETARKIVMAIIAGEVPNVTLRF